MDFLHELADQLFRIKFPPLVSLSANQLLAIQIAFNPVTDFCNVWTIFLLPNQSCFFLHILLAQLDI
jgi:hypothetical protein